MGVSSLCASGEPVEANPSVLRLGLTLSRMQIPFSPRSMQDKQVRRPSGQSGTEEAPRSGGSRRHQGGRSDLARVSSG